MADILKIKNLLKALKFSLDDGEDSVWSKKYANHSNYKIKLDFKNEKIDYGNEITLGDKTTCNFKASENFVVLECVNRLLEKGYKPKNITLEKIWATGHGTSGKLDVLVTRDEGDAYLMIECKTYGAEFDKEFKKVLKDGGQIFTYFQQDKNANVLMLYASEVDGNGKLKYRNEIVNIEDDYRQTGNVKDLYDRWNKLPKNNGVFDDWVKVYDFQSKALTLKSLKEIKQEDSGFIFNQFLEILRHNVVSDKPNAFNKIFTLFLCKIYDEKVAKSDEELAFQWFYTPYQYEGRNYPPDNNISFQKRLTDLYKKGMKEFLGKEVTDISDSEFEKKYGDISEKQRKAILDDLVEIRLKKNNEFAIKEVFNDESFEENAKVVKEVVELLQGYKIRYTKKQQYLSDFFELLLTTGLKQESGQFFTPVPIAQFIIKSLPIDKIVSDKLQKGEKDNLLPTVIDYAAGSGHFITESMHEIQRIVDNKNPDEFIPDIARKIKSWKEDHFDWAYQYVYGIEKDYRLVKVGKVGCYLHGDGLAQIIHSDGLANFQNSNEYTGLLKKSDKDFPKENKQFDIVVSNPPYSVAAFKNNARKYYTEKDFDIYEKLTDQSSEIECLFIERTKQLLKDGGIAGIILPSSILSNEGIYTKAREIILEYFEIVAMAELGSNTFMATNTSTVTLFLRRRNNYDAKNIRAQIEKVVSNLKDVTINQIEKPLTKYVSHVWEGLKFEDYVTLLQKQPNKAVEAHEIFKEYKSKIKQKNDKEFWNSVIALEQEKLCYFILTFSQKVVIVRTGEKNEEKQFLGYEFSNRRGSEGIHPIQKGKAIEECTRLFDPEIFENPEKASTYIYKAFNGDFESEIHEDLLPNVSRFDLVDSLTFDRASFEKTISLSVKKKVKIDSKWEEIKLSDFLLELQSGNRPKGGVGEYRDGIPSLGGEHIGLDGKVSLTNMKFVPERYFNDAKQGVLKDFDILICKDGALTGKVAIFESSNFPYPSGMVNEHVFILRAKDVISQSYLFALLYSNSGQSILKSNITGQAQGGLNRENLLNIKIPLPPKEIQEKIVLEINKLEEREHKARAGVADLSNKIENLFLLEKHNLVPLQQMLEGINPPKDGVIKKLNKDSFVSFLSMADVSNEAKIINLQKKKLNEVSKGFTFFQKGDVLLAKITPCMENGKGALINTDLENNIGFGSTEFFVLRSKQGVINPKFLFYIVKSKKFRALAEKAMTGASGHRRVPKAFVEKFEVPHVPYLEQNEIVSKIEKIESEISKLEAELSEIPAKKEAVLKKYL